MAKITLGLLLFVLLLVVARPIIPRFKTQMAIMIVGFILIALFVWQANASRNAAFREHLKHLPPGCTPSSVELRCL